ncbi:hypothetical protein Taro_034827 [Colocasia esculenta]|uniref:Uncharacterized protein n=1 Tax=Colocasia esculenta TaxID=4460 RepID=A0A843W8Q3_COLES|nr:hypothetical protein [Colocasia esculenta]
MSCNAARRQWTYAKAKKTYGGLDKGFLVQSRVFSVERWSKSRESVSKIGSGRSVQNATQESVASRS